MTHRVLVIEDEPLIALDIEFAAADAGCEVVGSARSIDEALHLLETLDCSGAILDANLNGKSAKPIVDRLEEIDLPYIVVSGYNRSQLEFLNENKVLIGKPFSMSELTNTIRQELVAKTGQTTHKKDGC